MLIIAAYICILINVESSLSLKIFPESDEFQRTNISTLKRFVFNYKDHVFMIHDDKLPTINVVTVLKILPPVQLFSENNFPRPSTKNIVDIFFIHNSSDVTSYRHTSKVFNQDGCNLFITLEILPQLCQLDCVKLAPASFIFDINGNQLFSCFTENENFSLTLVEENQLDILHVFHKTYENLHRKIIKLYFIHNPTIICRRQIGDDRLELVASGTCDPIGPEAELVKVIGKTMNFKPEFWIFEHLDGKQLWNEMLHAISRGEAEFGAGAIYLSADGHVHYTSFICSAGPFVTFFVNPTKEFNLEMILKTFDLTVYFFSFLTLIIIIIITIAFSYLVNQSFWNNQYSFNLMKLVVEQGSNLNCGLYSYNAMKFILSLWLIFNIIFSAAIKSKISSALIKPEAYDFRSIEDLSENDFRFTISQRFQEMFLEKYNRSNIRIVEMDADRNYENVEEVCPETLYFFRLRYAFVHGEFNLVLMNQMCKYLYPVDRIKDQRYLMESRVYQALPISPSSPYKKQFTKIIDRLKEAGILSYWYKHMEFENLGDYNTELAPPKPLEFKQIYSFFILLIVGLGIGIIVLFLEIIEAALKQRWNNTITILEKL